MSRRRGALVIAVTAMIGVTAACSGGSSGSSTTGPNTLRVLAGSELKDMQPILDDAKKATGVTLVPEYSGSLDGAEKVAGGAPGIDAAWFASDKYIALAGAGARILARQRIALSPVVVGVRQDVAQRLGWSSGDVSWADLAAAAGKGQFHFAMTNPTASNSGFSALVGLADALTGGQALSTSNIDKQGITQFLSGQALSSGSSGFLVDAYVNDQDRLDGMVNYESVLVTLNQSGRLHQPLTLIYPSEGIVTADYPLMLLNADKRAAFDKVTAYLTRPEVQARMQQLAARRAVTPGVAPDRRLSSALLVEAPFPGSLDVAQHLLDEYNTELRRPARTVYVLDMSSSMEGDRVSRLKQALLGLAGLDNSFTGHFTRFAPREQVTMLPFSTTAQTPQVFDIDSSDPASPSLTAVRQYISNLEVGGDTAIFSALDAAYDAALRAHQEDASAYTSIVLMTDGENNTGISAQQFTDRITKRPASERDIRIFTVLFGDANPKELQRVASASGGQVFDARTTSLDAVFKEIRGYQ
ncbi:MAG TPA: substrate-binding and VWA domain-containing protein [Acidimicrobiales bacterium]|nr:substrate-binding and VWA domain-containing protein [Acidimicrobiales bacterium]